MRQGPFVARDMGRPAGLWGIGHGGSYHSPQHTVIFLMHRHVSILPTTFLLEHFEACLAQG